MAKQDPNHLPVEDYSLEEQGLVLWYLKHVDKDILIERLVGYMTGEEFAQDLEQAHLFERGATIEELGLPKSRWPKL